MKIAKSIIKNKFWVVEQDGEQIATIQSCPDGVSYVQDHAREKFASVNLLKTKHNVSFSNERRKKSTANVFEVSGYPCDCKPYNSLFNLSKKLPVYTKINASKSFFCAGHYLIKFAADYVQTFCPKLITLNRYDFIGPFVSKQEMKEVAKSLKDVNNGNHTAT